MSRHFHTINHANCTDHMDPTETWGGREKKIAQEEERTTKGAGNSGGFPGLLLQEDALLLALFKNTSLSECYH